jgi:hypothetical protein
MFQHPVLTDRAIRDTVRAVFSASRYDDRRSLGARLWGWLLTHIITPVLDFVARLLQVAW